MKTQLVGLAYVFVILPVFLFGWSQFQDYQLQSDNPDIELNSPEVRSLIYHEVEDYDKWKEEFDDFYDTRKESGELNYEVGVLEDSPNTVYVLNTWKTHAAYKTFKEKEDLKNSMESAGVVGQPVFLLLDKKDASTLEKGSVKSLIYHMVEDYTMWKEEFDAFANNRISMGEKGFEVGVLNGNPNFVYVMNAWNSSEDFKSFIQSKELKEAMTEAGVKDEPKFLILKPRENG